MSERFGQQPFRFTQRSEIGIIGAGRLGSSLGIAMSWAGYKIVAASTRRASHQAWLSRQIDDCEVTASPARVLEMAEVVFMATPDSAVQPVCDSLRWRPGMAVVHCSGALPLSALGSAARSGAATGGLHPMQTFPRPDYADRLGGVTFGLEASELSLSAWLHSLVHSLGGRTLDIRSEHRAAYHAASVMSSGLLATLIGLAAELWQPFGATREEALKALGQLVRSTAEAVHMIGLPAALTGPYVRGDVETVQRHLHALMRHSPDVARAYVALALAGLPMAAEQDSLTPEARRAMEAALIETLRRVHPPRGRELEKPRGPLY